MNNHYQLRDFFTDEKIVSNMKNCRYAILTNEKLFKKSIFSTYIFMIFGTLFLIGGFVILIWLLNFVISFILGGLSLICYIIYSYKKYYLNSLFSIILDAVGDNREIDENTFSSFYDILNIRIYSLIWFDFVLFLRNLLLPALTYSGMILVGNYIIVSSTKTPITEILIGIYTLFISLFFFFLFFRNNYIHKISKFILLDIYRRNGYFFSDAEYLYNELKVDSPLIQLLSLNVYKVSKEFREYIVFLPKESLTISTKLHRAVSTIPIIGNILGFFIMHLEFFQDIYMLGFKDFIIYAYYSSVYEYCRVQSPGVGKARINDDFYII